MRQALALNVVERWEGPKLLGVVYSVWSKLLIVSAPIQVLHVGLRTRSQGSRSPLKSFRHIRAPTCNVRIFGRIIS